MKKINKRTLGIILLAVVLAVYLITTRINSQDNEVDNNDNYISYEDPANTELSLIEQTEEVEETSDTDAIVSITEANQNFSRIARMVDEYGQVIIMKNNAPKYVLTEFNQADNEGKVSDEELKKMSEKLIKKNHKVYEELAK